MTDAQGNDALTLRGMDFRPEYRRGHGVLVRDFFVPCLRVAREYLRAAGYFTSGSLALVAAGLPAFIAHDGSFRLIASPYLDKEDVAALEEGVTARAEVIERALIKPLAIPQEDEIVRDRLGFLAWLIATDRLSIRIALPREGSGLYHEKYGVFVDARGDAVAFTGSPNETRGGLESNFESIDVFKSWTAEGFRVGLKQAAFEAAWANELPGLETVALPDAVKRHLLLYRPKTRPESDPLESPPEPPGVQDDVSNAGDVPREYQLEAVAAWNAAGHRGVLEMATGTGKTITALLAATALAQSQSPCMIVVAAPFKHLVDQWDGEMRRFGLTPILCYEDGATWGQALARMTSDLLIGVRTIASCIATHDALRGSRFAAWFDGLPPTVHTILIADEVHNLGAPASLMAVSALNFRSRMGLSATPRRWSDEETAGVFDYFGPTVFEFPLERAIREHFLVPYDYFPHVVELTEEEFAKYAEISMKLAKFGPSPSGAQSKDDSAEEIRGSLLRQRAAVLNNAEAKLDSLESLLDGSRLRFALAYTTPERINETVRVVADDGRRLVHRFTYHESARERRRLLNLFADGGMDALVAIRCLDEGVDIPRTETAYLLASSSNSREFIQRRGRILRRADGKDHAVMHDFIAVPPRGIGDEATWRYERSIVRRELGRFDEFASLARNRYEAEAALLAVRRRYALFDL